jgi:phage head maturation protease
MTTIAPRNWNASKIEHRFSTTGPQSYDAEQHSCLAIISTGAPVQRVFGIEILQISNSAIDLSRVPVPLLDSHNQSSVVDNVLGRIENAWISGGALHGRIVFAQTPRGKMAEGMVGRGEVAGISAGYRVDKWSAKDAQGDEVDPDRASWSDDLIFTATRWSLLECSLVGVPADAMATVRSLGENHNTDTANAKQRMLSRQRMIEAKETADVKARMLHRQAIVDGASDSIQIENARARMAARLRMTVSDPTIVAQRASQRSQMLEAQQKFRAALQRLQRIVNSRSSKDVKN